MRYPSFKSTSPYSHFPYFSPKTSTGCRGKATFIWYHSQNITGQKLNTSLEAFLKVLKCLSIFIRDAPIWKIEPMLISDLLIAVMAYVEEN